MGTLINSNEDDEEEEEAVVDWLFGCIGIVNQTARSCPTLLSGGPTSGPRLKPHSCSMLLPIAWFCHLQSFWWLSKQNMCQLCNSGGLTVTQEVLHKDKHICSSCIAINILCPFDNYALLRRVISFSRCGVRYSYFAIDSSQLGFCWPVLWWLALQSAAG